MMPVVFLFTFKRPFNFLDVAVKYPAPESACRLFRFGAAKLSDSCNQRLNSFDGADRNALY
jgi:hypothetical protein